MAIKAALLERQIKRGLLVKERRDALEFTQSKLAVLVGVTPAAIYNLEAGKTGEMKGPHLVKLSRILEIDPLDLILEDIGSAISVVSAVKLFAAKNDYQLTAEQVYKIAVMLADLAEIHGQEVTAEYIGGQLPALLPMPV